jgi:hypothetical protein
MARRDRLRHRRGRSAISLYKHESDLPYRIAPFGPEQVKLWIGPGAFVEFDTFCYGQWEARTPCQVPSRWQ